MPTTYEGRISADDMRKPCIVRVGGLVMQLASGQLRLVAALGVRVGLTSRRLYGVVTTAVVDLEGMGRWSFHRERAGRVRVYQPEMGGFTFELPEVPALVAPEVAPPVLSDETFEAYQVALAEHMVRQNILSTEVSRLAHEARRATAFAAMGRFLLFTGYKGRVFELPGDRLVTVVRPAGSEVEIEAEVCCWYAARHVVQATYHGFVDCPAHTPACPRGTNAAPAVETPETRSGL